MKISFRIATIGDLQSIVRLLADDYLGRTRENDAPHDFSIYEAAFHEILNSPENEVLVGILNSQVVACLQMTYIPNLTLKGTKRVLIEGVRVSSSLRGKGVGKQVFEFALKRAKERGCGLAQLTTNKARPDALKFYESLGFAATHEGMKLKL